MTAPASSTGEIGFDQPLHFTIADRDARGRIVRLGPVLQEILGAHDYPASVKQILAEALTLTALIGTLLKDGEGQMTMQAQTEDGVIEMLVCDYRGGELRGYAKHDRSRLDELGPNPSLFSLFGQGYLAITFDLEATGQRYQGIVPLEGSSLSEACENYFFQSEQVPTLLKVAVDLEPSGCIAAGLLVQHLPEGEEGRERLHVRLDHPEWEHIAALAGSLRQSELIDQTLSLEALIWRLFHEEREIRINQGAKLCRGCRCTVAHFQDVIARFPIEERAHMKNDDGLIVVDCAFCSKEFVIPD